MGTLKKKIKHLLHRKAVSYRGAEEQNQELDSYKEKLRQHRKQLLIRTSAVAAAVLAAVFITKTVVERWHYDDYKVVSSSVQEDTLGSQYVQLESNLLRYTGDGATLISSSGKSLWSQAYELNNPRADACGSTSVIYEEGGTNMMIFGRGGKMGEVSTELPILKARVASQGVVATILEDGEDTWINFYSAAGAQIATGRTRVDSPGYPVDLAVSPDGMLIMVTYMYVENNSTTSYVAFYNFGSTGQGQMDNMVSGYTYEGLLVPQVAYLAEGASVAFREDGFVIYRGKQIPKVACEVTVDKEIVSTFYNENYVGMVFRSEDAEKRYTLVLYNDSGKQVFEEKFNIDYTSIRISDDQILMNNDSQLCVFSLKGHEKFNGNLDEGKIQDVFKIDANRYQVIVDGGIKTIKLS